MADLNKFVEEIKGLTLVEVSELVKNVRKRNLELVPAAPACSCCAPVAAAPVAEEKTEFTVVLKAAGENKIATIKAVREITAPWTFRSKSTC